MIYIFSILLHYSVEKTGSDNFTNFLLFFSHSSEVFQQFADCHRYCGSLFSKHKELKCLRHYCPAPQLYCHHITLFYIIVNPFCHTAYKLKKSLKIGEINLLIISYVFFFSSWAWKAACAAERQQYFYEWP